MDFWSRLVGGYHSASSKPSRTSTPVERQTAFKKTCNSLQQIWRTSNSPSGELVATVRARNCIDRLNAVLSDESRGPAPHPCLSYASTSQIFVTVTKLTLTYRDEDLIRSAAVFFNTLIDAEVDGIVDNRVFSRALVDLVRRIAVDAEDVEGRLVELLFGVANNIRLQPKILPAWFTPKQSQDPEQDSESKAEEVQFAGATRRDDFPLFYLLVDNVHREGRAGDFARTGLLYLIETGQRSRDLEKWLIESDLATLMATGLGALYSQLSRNVSSTFSEGSVPTIIALSDEGRIQTPLQLQSGADMDSFLSYLLFWQDTLDHCRSAEVNDNLLDHFQVLFLQQLLYPSLLESSDVKGGSTSAVLTYLCRILEAIDQPELIHRILHFLLASPTEADPVVETVQQVPHQKHMSISRRKSIDMLAALAEEAAKPSPSLFNLVDLIMMSIKSQNRETIVATLRLVTVILRRHHSFAGSLIKTTEPTAETRRTVGALNAELRSLLSLASSIMDDDPALDESYENYSKDATFVLESRLFVPSPRSSVLDGPVDQPLDIRTDDAVFKEILLLTGNFFSNSVAVNLALTDGLTSLASSNLVSLNGWLLVEPSKYEYKTKQSPSSTVTSPELNEISKVPGVDDSDPLAIVKHGLTEPTWSAEHTPPIPQILQRLVGQIRRWRKDIPDFDVLVAARRDLLHNDDVLTEISTSTSRQPSQAPASRIPQPDQEPTSPRGRPSDVHDDTASLSVPHSAVGSPLRRPNIATDDSRTPSRSRPLVAEDLRRRLAVPYRADSSGSLVGTEPEAASAVGPAFEAETALSAEEEPLSAAKEDGSVTLGHILTNVVILYEFILELTALVQVRATLFEEAGYL